MKKYVETMDKIQLEMNSGIVKRNTLEGINRLEKTEDQIGKLETRWKKDPNRVAIRK